MTVVSQGRTVEVYVPHRVAVKLAAVEARWDQSSAECGEGPVPQGAALHSAIERGASELYQDYVVRELRCDCPDCPNCRGRQARRWEDIADEEDEP